MHGSPDLIGRELNEALDILKNFHFNISIIETISPKMINNNGECRIINQILNEDGIKLITSYF